MLRYSVRINGKAYHVGVDSQRGKIGFGGDLIRFTAKVSSIGFNLQICEATRHRAIAEAMRGIIINSGA